VTQWVVVGWTPDEYGEVALRFALADARTYGRSIVVVNGTKGDALVDDRYAGSEQLAAVRTLLEESGVPHDVRQSMGVDVAEQVLGVASELGARLIVLGLRRRTPVGKLLMGSVAQRVILDATCPVLCVKPGSTPD
jgi:nucleotide-binding universal stress UspA family protein